MVSNTFSEDFDWKKKTTFPLARFLNPGQSPGQYLTSFEITPSIFRNCNAVTTIIRYVEKNLFKHFQNKIVYPLWFWRQNIPEKDY